MKTLSITKKEVAAKRLLQKPWCYNGEDHTKKEPVKDFAKYPIIVLHNDQMIFVVRFTYFALFNSPFIVELKVQESIVPMHVKEGRGVIMFANHYMVNLINDIQCQYLKTVIRLVSILLHSLPNTNRFYLCKIYQCAGKGKM